MAAPVRYTHEEIMRRYNFTAIRVAQWQAPVSYTRPAPGQAPPMYRYIIPDSPKVPEATDDEESQEETESDDDDEHIVEVPGSNNFEEVAVDDILAGILKKPSFSAPVVETIEDAAPAPLPVRVEAKPKVKAKGSSRAAWSKPSSKTKTKTAKTTAAKLERTAVVAVSPEVPVPPQQCDIDLNALMVSTISQTPAGIAAVLDDAAKDETDDVIVIDVGEPAGEAASEVTPAISLNLPPLETMSEPLMAKDDLPADDQHGLVTTKPAADGEPDSTSSSIVDTTSQEAIAACKVDIDAVGLVDVVQEAESSDEQVEADPLEAILAGLRLPAKLPTEPYNAQGVGTASSDPLDMLTAETNVSAVPEASACITEASALAESAQTSSAEERQSGPLVAMVDELQTPSNDDLAVLDLDDIVAIVDGGLEFDSPVADDASAVISVASDDKHVSFAPGTPEPKPTKRKKKSNKDSLKKRRPSNSAGGALKPEVDTSEIVVLPVSAEVDASETLPRFTPDTIETASKDDVSGTIPEDIIVDEESTQAVEDKASYATPSTSKKPSSKSKSSSKSGGILTAAGLLAFGGKSKSKSKDKEKKTKKGNDKKSMADATSETQASGLGIDLVAVAPKPATHGEQQEDLDIAGSKPSVVGTTHRQGPDAGDVGMLDEDTEAATTAEMDKPISDIIADGQSNHLGNEFPVDSTGTTAIVEIATEDDTAADNAPEVAFEHEGAVRVTVPESEQTGIDDAVVITDSPQDNENLCSQDHSTVEDNSDKVAATVSTQESVLDVIDGVEIVLAQDTSQSPADDILSRQEQTETDIDSLVTTPSKPHDDTAPVSVPAEIEAALIKNAARHDSGFDDEINVLAEEQVTPMDKICELQHPRINEGEEDVDSSATNSAVGMTDSTNIPALNADSEPNDALHETADDGAKTEQPCGKLDLDAKIGDYTTDIAVVGAHIDESLDELLPQEVDVVSDLAEHVLSIDNPGDIVLPATEKTLAVDDIARDHEDERSDLRGLPGAGKLDGVASDTVSKLHMEPIEETLQSTGVLLSPQVSISNAAEHSETGAASAALETSPTTDADTVIHSEGTQVVNVDTGVFESTGDHTSAIATEATQEENSTIGDHTATTSDADLVLADDTVAAMVELDTVASTLSQESSKATAVGDVLAFGAYDTTIAVGVPQPAEKVEEMNDMEASTEHPEESVESGPTVVELVEPREMSPLQLAPDQEPESVEEDDGRQPLETEIVVPILPTLDNINTPRSPILSQTSRRRKSERSERPGFSHHQSKKAETEYCRSKAESIRSSRDDERSYGARVSLQEDVKRKSRRDSRRADEERRVAQEQQQQAEENEHRRLRREARRAARKAQELEDAARLARQQAEGIARRDTEVRRRRREKRGDGQPNTRDGDSARSGRLPIVSTLSSGLSVSRAGLFVGTKGERDSGMATKRELKQRERRDSAIAKPMSSAEVEVGNSDPSVSRSKVNAETHSPSQNRTYSPEVDDFQTESGRRRRTGKVDGERSRRSRRASERSEKPPSAETKTSGFFSSLFKTSR